MTSLLESSSTIDIKSAVETAERLTAMLCSYGDDGTANSHHNSDSPLVALDDDLWKELYLLPTPPLSPDCLSTTESNSTPEEVSDAGGEGLYLNMLEYDQMMDALEEAERALSDSSQQSLQQDLLLQDCMWSGGHCADHPTAKQLMLNAVGSAAATLSTHAATPGGGGGVVGDTNSTCDSNDNPSLVPVDDSQGNHTDPEPDCVEPSAVFPALRASSGESTRSLSKVPACGGGGRHTLSSTRSRSLSSSESGEDRVAHIVECLRFFHLC